MLKKHLLLLSFLLISNLTVLAQIDISELNLKGTVKSISEISYKAVLKQGEIEKKNKAREREGDFDFYILFQENGLKIRKDLFLTKNNESYKRTLNYNKKGFLIQRIWYNLDGSINQEWKYTLDEKGKPVIAENLSINKSSKKQYRYDESENLIENSSYTSNDSLIYKETYTYNHLDLMTEKSRYSSPEKLIYTKVFNYDEKGNNTEILRHLTNAKFLFEKFNFKYNHKNQKIEELYYNISGKLAYKKVFKYNRKGLVKKIEKFQVLDDNDSSELKLAETKIFNYYFDKQKNWIKKIVFLNEEPVFIFEREIEYY